MVEQGYMESVVWTKIMRVSFLYPIMLSQKFQKHVT